jgi:hypothetical protein
MRGEGGGGSHILVPTRPLRARMGRPVIFVGEAEKPYAWATRGGIR